MAIIKFNEEAKTWNEAFPIGNGRIGAMIFANTKREHIQINGDSIWYGGPQNRVNKDAREQLPKIRKLILDDENIEAAEQLMQYALSGTPQSERPYQTAGDIWINWEENSDIEIMNYDRILDLNEGIVKCEYTRGKNKIQKEYLASYPGQLMTVHIKSEDESSMEHTLSCSIMMSRERFYDGAGKLDDNTIKLWGNCGEGGVKFLIGLRAVTEGGTVTVCGEHLLIKDAKEITLYIAIETSFYEHGDLEAVLKKRLDKGSVQGYERIRQLHMEDYKKLMDRVTFSLGSNDTKTSMQNYVESYFQFGRYLCISASRENSLPANLQGIWNDSMTPAWDSKYTININLEMNYWPVEMCSLPECHLPLFDLLKRMQIEGKKVAKDMYGCRGFVAHHNTDIWADCAPQDIYLPATYWVMGGAWLATHIWTHYIYTKDKEFLANMYSVLKDAVLFFQDFLVEVDGQLLTCPSVSPENTYILPSGMQGCICAGATMDSEILRDLCDAYLKASRVLNIQDEVVEKTKEMVMKIPKNCIGKYGQLMEWRKDYEELEPGHRHISHLYGLHPSHQITVDKTPELAKAAAVTLERRLQNGGGHTGWSCAWIVNFFARLGDGEKAWENLKKMFEKSTFPNRMSNHPMLDFYVFQIDGNYGATSGICEMLLQSDEDRTILLPALPKEWSEGQIKGLSMVGGATVDLEWKDCKLTKAVIHAKQDLQTVICFEGNRVEINLVSGEDFCVIE